MTLSPEELSIFKHLIEAKHAINNSDTAKAQVEINAAYNELTDYIVEARAKAVGL